MKKGFMMVAFVVTFCALMTATAFAVTNNTVKIGLKYGSDALFSANLENAEGSGYTFGYYDDARSFAALGTTSETAISMTAAGRIYVSSAGGYSTGASGAAQTIGEYHVQLERAYETFSEATAEASGYAGGYPAYIGGSYRVRIGSYTDAGQAEAACAAVSGTVEKSSSTGVLVTKTKTTQILFEFDYQGALNLGVEPNGQGGKAVTWFKGYRYCGGFEYQRVTGGNLNVLNVVNLEDYVRGVVPYEMSGDWPLAALEAQAVCARTYVCNTTKHARAYGFDVCNTTDCQVYYGINRATERSDQAVSNTAGKCLYYNGKLIDAVYFSSDGGATEDAVNVWGGQLNYLKGKVDPFEATITIPNYRYTTTYTAAQLTWVLQNSGYSIGTIRNVYVSEYTPMGNVYKVTFEDTSGNTKTVKGDTCRTIFYSSTYGKSVKSMRFTIGGGSTAAYYVNGSDTLNTLSGVSVISGSGTVSSYTGSKPYVITASGTAELSSGGSTASSGNFTITGTGSGHNVGMSQWGAYAMAQQGYTYPDILNFYYTDVTIG